MPSDHWTRCTVDWSASSLTVQRTRALPYFDWHDGVMNRPANKRPSGNLTIWSIRLSEDGIRANTGEKPVPVGGRPSEYNWEEMKAHAFSVMEARGLPMRKQQATSYPTRPHQQRLGFLQPEVQFGTFRIQREEQAFRLDYRVRREDKNRFLTISDLYRLRKCGEIRTILHASTR